MKKLLALIFLASTLAVRAAYPSFQDITNMLAAMNAPFTSSGYNSNVVVGLTLTNSNPFLNGYYVKTNGNPGALPNSSGWYVCTNGAKIASYLVSGYTQWVIGTNAIVQPGTSCAYGSSNGTNTLYPDSNYFWYTSMSPPTYPPTFSPSFQSVSNINFSYIPSTNYVAGTNIVFTPSGNIVTISAIATNYVAGTNVTFTGTSARQVINVTIPANTNALTAAQTNVLGNALTNNAGGLFSFDDTAYAHVGADNYFTHNNQFSGETFYPGTAYFFNTISAGWNSGGGALGANQNHFFDLMVPGYSSAAANLPAISAFSTNATTAALVLGASAGIDQNINAATTILFCTATNTGGAFSPPDWTMDSFGNFYPGSTAANSTAALGLPTAPVYAGYFNTLSATNLTLIGKTNQIVFGGTNTVTAVQTNVVSVSVQVAGDTNKYFLRLYK